MRLKIIAILTLILFLLPACASTAWGYSFDLADPPEFLDRVYWHEFAYPDSGYDDYTISTLDQWLDNDLFQNAVSEIPVEYPLNDDYRVTLYSWALRDICISMETFSEEYVPCTAHCFSDNVIYIMFLEPQYANSYYDGPVPVAYVSAEDGHLIHFEIAQ